MDAKQHFKREFLDRCKAAGLSDSEIESRVDVMLERLKTAGWADYVPGMGTVGSFTSGMGKSLGGEVPALGIGAYLGLPLAAGFAGGAGLAKLNDLGDEDPEEVRTHESIDSYRNLARQMSISDRLRAINRPEHARSPLIR